jgi:hypothetical protein
MPLPATIWQAGAQGAPTVSTISTQDVRAAIAVGALALACVACAGTSSSPTAQTPSPTPDASAPVTSPEATGSSGLAVVALDNATGNNVRVEIVAPAGLVVNAASGRPADGVSVEPYQLVATNDDDTTLRLTWSGGPCDALDRLIIDPELDRLVLIQPECPGDAVAFDRVLVVRLGTAIDGGSLSAVVQDGLDTSD